MPPRLHELSEEDLLSACLWAEARGEPEAGQIGVCNVVLNRVRKGMAASLHEVILKPYQFSWTSPRDPNHARVFTAMTDDVPGWQRAKRIARKGLAGKLADNTGGADHYLNVTLVRKLPKWADEAIKAGKVSAKIGRHTFINLLGSAGVAG